MTRLTPSVLSSGRAVRLEVSLPEFFFTPLAKLSVEQEEFTGRVYVLKGERIVAVAKPVEKTP